MFRLKDKEQLYQWDSNVFVEVEDPRINQVQFSTKFSASAYCVEVADSKAPIPNEMLQSYYDICAYACVVDENGQSVEYSETFSVYARPKPDNYIYTPTEVITITKVEDELLKQINSKVGIQPQDFTEEEKRIARENIGAISSSDDSKMFYINVTDSSCDKTFTEVVRAYNSGSSIAAINSFGQIFPLTSVSKVGSVIRAFWFNKYSYPKVYEIYLSDTGSYSYRVISYAMDWDKDETEPGYISNRTHYIHRVKTKMDKDKTLASQTNTKLTDAQEDALAELGANTKSSSSLSFYLAPTSTLPENPPTVENTVVKVYYKPSSSTFSDVEAEFDVVELKSNDELVGYALNFNNDNASYKSYLRTVVIVMIPYKGVKAGVYLPEYEASIFTGRGYSLEYESVHKLDKKFIPDEAFQEQQQSDWNETDETSKAFIKNKPTISSGLSNLIDGAKEASVRSIAAYPEEDTGDPDSDYKLDVGAYALGRNTKASMMDAFAIGRDNEVTGDASYVGGVGSKCQANYSHAEGLYTEAKGYNQYVYGKYNISNLRDDLSFIMGNGTNEQRSNSHTLSKTGEAWFAGDVYTGSTSGINKDSGSKKLATEEFVRDLTSASGGSGEKEWRLLQTIEITEPVTSFEIDKDSDGNPFSVNEIHIVASNITASASTNPMFFYEKDQPSYLPTHQIINGSFTDSAKYWNFYAFLHGKLDIFTLTSQWNNGALQYVPVNHEISGSKIAYFRLSVPYNGQTLNTGTFKIYGR